MKNTLLVVTIVGIFTSCVGDYQDDSAEDVESLTLADIPMFDTTGKQSLYREISPYEVKGIEPPEEEDESKYHRAYHPLEFIENAHEILDETGYIVGSILTFSHSLVEDSVFAKQVFNTIKKTATRSYLGTERQFLDSLDKANNYISSHKLDTIRKKTVMDYKYQ